MQMPVDVLEKLGARSKRIASPDVNLEQLKREDQSTRKQWWEEIKANKEEYDNLSYDRDKFFESNMALARLKLVLTFIDNDENPPEHSYTREELNLLREFEQYLVYDRLSAEEIKEYVRSEKEDGGVIKLAKQAALNGYDQVYKIIEQKNIPTDLAFAMQRIYKDRIEKMEIAASEMKLSDIYKGIDKAETQGIGAQDLQNMERAYIIKTEKRLKSPEGDIKWNKWSGVQKFDRMKSIYKELKNVKQVSMEVFKATMPHALGIRAVNKKPSMFIFKKSVLALELKVVSDYREILASGHEADHISYSELMLHVEEATKKMKNHPYVLALAATTHWEGKAIDYAKEGAGLYPDLCLVLIDLRDKRMYYNEDDKRLENVLGFIEP